MAKRKNNTLSNLGKTTKPTKEETQKVLPESEIKLTETVKPKVTRAKTKSIEKITIIETNEQNLNLADNIEEAIVVEEANPTNVVIDDMIDVVKDASNAQEIKDKKSQYKHPLLQEIPASANPYENLTHLYAALMQDMAKFQQELFSATWKIFIEQSNTVIGQYYGMLNAASKIKK
jgi:hypothetical protein